MPGAHDLRAVFARRRRGTSRACPTRRRSSCSRPRCRTSRSTPSAPIINYGGQAEITGTLYLPGTTTPDPGVSVTLWGHTDGQKWHTVGNPDITLDNGGYGFSVNPSNNTVYQVRTTFTPPARRDTAVLFEGVRDVVTIGASSMTSVVGGSVTFKGTVSPDKAGHAIYLERLGADGDWHVVAIGVVRPDSTYSFSWTFGTPGGEGVPCPHLRAALRTSVGVSPPVTIQSRCRR